MCEWSPPSASFRAGAITVANRIGVISGTAIWRGLLAVSAARRRASVERAARVAMRGSFLSGGFRGGGAGQVEVDVVERRRTRLDAEWHDAELGESRHDLRGAAARERQCERAPDGERVAVR